jgi:hypothetical protein
MTPIDLVNKVCELHPFAAVVPKGAETVIHLGRPFGSIRVMGDGRLACKGIMPPALADVLIDY